MPRLIENLRSRGLSNREARDLMTSGKVFYYGIPTADEGREVDGERIEIRPDAPRIRPGRDLAVIYRDEHLAVVWKPAGLLSVSARGRGKERNVIGIAGRLLGSAFPVHRLDEPTSGLMMVALTEACQRQIKELLFNHRIERRYRAIVRGWFQKTPCTVRSLLVRDRGDGRRGSATDDDNDDNDDNDKGKEGVTRLRLLEHLGPRASLVEARLETGRTHQVRIHLCEKKHPILGDELYGGSGVGRAAPRLALHACELGLRHPVTGEKLKFEAPLADDLEALRRRLLRRVEATTSRGSSTRRARPRSKR